MRQFGRTDAAERLADVVEELKGRPALARAETIPSAWFTEPRFHQLDSEAIFARTWQGVGHEGRLPEEGSWFVADVAGDPVVVVRDGSGELRAFYNVCRHRGGPLATQDGCGRVLQCEYHGWTYQLDGTLRGVQHWNLVELFDREDIEIPFPHRTLYAGSVSEPFKVELARPEEGAES